MFFLSFEIFIVTKYKIMKRGIFIILFFLPFISAFFIPLNFYYFILASVFLIIIGIFRLRYIGCNGRQILKAFLLGPLVDCWWKMWSKDIIKSSNSI
jgi:hypothetical protein